MTHLEQGLEGLEGKEKASELLVNFCKKILCFRWFGRTEGEGSV